MKERTVVVATTEAIDMANAALLGSSEGISLLLPIAIMVEGRREEDGGGGSW